MTYDRQEMDDAHKERALRLLAETGLLPSVARQAEFLAAYNAVLLKEVLWCLSELLAYRQNEVHR